MLNPTPASKLLITGAIYREERPIPMVTAPTIRPFLLAGNHFMAFGEVFDVIDVDARPRKPPTERTMMTGDVVLLLIIRPSPMHRPPKAIVAFGATYSPSLPAKMAQTEVTMVSTV